MLKHLAASFLSVAVLALPLSAVSAERRVALVIGNGAYEHASPLQTPPNDAAAMAEKLRALGFEVIDGADLSKREMEQSIGTFADTLRGADVGLFYYAGHGLQVDGRNFLAPVDATLRSDTDLDFEAIELDRVLEQLKRNSKVSIVFLDASRDNPLAANLARGGASLSVGRGLAPVEEADGMLIAFAAQPGAVASDGNGPASLFTAALLRYIDAQDTSVSDVMVKVRNDVRESTNGQQIPWSDAALPGEIYLSSEKKTANLAPEVQTGAEADAATGEMPEPLAAVDQAALTRDIQTKLKALGCYGGKIDGDWGRGTRAGIEGFNEIADLDLNVDEAEQASLDSLAAWKGADCPAATVVHRKDAPAPKKTQAKTKKTYTKPPKQAKQKQDIETDTVHRLLRPAR